MKKEESDLILKGLSSYFQGDLAYTIYEMIHPEDSFGKVMMENLNERGCILLGLEDIPNLDA